MGCIEQDAIARPASMFLLKDRALRRSRQRERQTVVRPDDLVIALAARTWPILKVGVGVIRSQHYDSYDVDPQGPVAPLSTAGSVGMDASRLRPSSPMAF